MRSGLLLLARSYSRRRSSLASCAAGPLLPVSRLLLSGWREWCGFSFLREGLAEGLRDPFPFSTGRLTISGLDRVLAFLPLRFGLRQQDGLRKCMCFYRVCTDGSAAWIWGVVRGTWSARMPGPFAGRLFP